MDRWNIGVGFDFSGGGNRDGISNESGAKNGGGDN